MEEVALREKPKLIVGGGSAYSREWDYKRMREIADKVGALLMIDMAHPAGLIAAGLLNNPLEYAHIVTSTTHKTLRGPRGGIILLGKDFENPWARRHRRERSRRCPNCWIPPYSHKHTGRSAGTRDRRQSRGLRRSAGTGIQDLL